MNLLHRPPMNLSSDPRPRETARRLLSSLLSPSSALAALFVATACAVTPYGASDANLEKARSSAERGATLFETQCAACHGERGEGQGGTPAIIGPGALKRYPNEGSLAASTSASSDGQRGALRPPGPEHGRPEFVSAESLQGYLVHHMPKIKRQPLSDEDYWSIVEFMLIAHGREVPPEGLSGSNGARVAIH